VEGTFLAQGTLYPDVIESLPAWGGPTAMIKSHHNVGGLPDDIEFRGLIEPLKYLFKDEVREVGAEVGRRLKIDTNMWHDILWRHPFPGPGLGIRIIGAPVTRERVAMLQEADYILLEELKNTPGKQHDRLYDDCWQALTILIAGAKTVGVMGDERTHDYPVIIRVVDSNDGTTASPHRFDPEFLEHVSNRIVNEVEGINRVAYDSTSKPPGTIEWE
jgi:GMP synthase (glutamine-hydrolysing)